MADDELEPPDVGTATAAAGDAVASMGLLPPLLEPEGTEALRWLDLDSSGLDRKEIWLREPMPPGSGGGLPSEALALAPSFDRDAGQTAAAMENPPIIGADATGFSLGRGL